LNIIIIENHEQIAKKMKSALECSNIFVFCVLNKNDAVALIRSKKPQLLIIDVPTIGFNLEDFLEETKGIGNKQQTFIATSSVENHYLAVDTMKMGAKYHLIKDKYFLEILPEVIKNIVRTILDENTLYERREILRKLTDNTSSAIFLFQDEKFILFNKSTEKLTGYSNEELKKMHFWDVVHPDAKELVRQRGLARQRGEIIANNYEFKIINKIGEVLWVDFSAAKVDWEGRPASIGTAYDITQIKKATKALKEREDQLRTLVQFAPDAVLQGDLKGFLVGVNSMCSQLTGYSEEELLKMHISDLFSREELAINPLRFDVLDSGKPMKNERKIRHKEGHDVPIEMHSKKMPDKTLLAFVRDISDRKKAEEVVFREKERLSSILKSIVDGVIAVNTEGCITLMNNSATKLTEWSQNEALLKPFLEIVNLQNSVTGEQLANPIDFINKSGKALDIPIEATLITKSNSEKIVEITGSPIKNKINNTVGTILVLRDVTEKQKLQYAAQKNQKLNSLGILAGGIAHDFNNLLGSIFGYIDLSIRYSKDPKIIKYLDKVMGNMERTQNLTQQLLTFAKGGEPVCKVEYLNPFVEETVEFALSGSNISAKFIIKDEFSCAIFDKHQMSQVIDNLVLNSCHAMPAGGNIEISVTCVYLRTNEIGMLEKGEYMKISVRDFGIGIPIEILPYVFDPFFTTKSSGHGLGLATCYSIVKRHNGELTVESEQGKGSVFNIFLPATKKEPDKFSFKVEEIYAETGTILIMDDDEILRETLKEILESFGFEVLATSKGEEVIDIFINQTRQREKIIAMIFDLTIKGGMGGKDTIEEIRKFDKTIPVFVASGYASDPIMAKPKEFGFTASINKPFRISELAQMLRKNLKLDT